MAGNEPTPLTTTPEGLRGHLWRPPRTGTSVTRVNREPDLRAGYYYTVKKGDSLWKISKTVYGSGAMWQAIAKANKVDINRPLKPGTKLFIPEKR